MWNTVFDASKNSHSRKGWSHFWLKKTYKCVTLWKFPAAYMPNFQILKCSKIDKIHAFDFHSRWKTLFLMLQKTAILKKDGHIFDWKTHTNAWLCQSFLQRKCLIFKFWSAPKSIKSMLLIFILGEKHCFWCFKKQRFSKRMVTFLIEKHIQMRDFVKVSCSVNA